MIDPLLEMLLRIQETRRRSFPTGGDLYERMFLDDAALPLVDLEKHLFVRPERDHDRASTEHLLASFCERRRDIRSAAAKFLRDCVGQLTHYGVASFRRTRDSDGITLRRIRGAQPLWLLGRAYEPVSTPPSHRVHFEPVRSQELWTISLPPRFGTPRQHRRMLAELRALSTVALGPSTDWERLAKGEQPALDYEQLRRHVDAAVLRVTAAWSWNARGLARERGTDYLYCYLHLAFRARVLQVVQHCIDELNTLLNSIGVRSRFQVIGSHNSEKAEGELTRIRSGEVSLVDAIRRS